MTEEEISTDDVADVFVDRYATLFRFDRSTDSWQHSSEEGWEHVSKREIQEHLAGVIFGLSLGNSEHLLTPEFFKAVIKKLEARLPF